MTKSDECWYPSKYGADDTIGAANNLSANIVKAAANKLVTRGKVYSLGIDIGPEAPRSGIHGYSVVVLPKGRPSGRPHSGEQITGFDDLVVAWQSVGTNMDGLGHVGINFQHYNGLHADEIYAPDGLKKLGIHAIPPIVSRGVVLDMAGYYGVDVVEEGTVFNVAEIKGAMSRQGVEIRKGDVVLLHTAWLNLLHTDRERLLAAWPGIGKEAAAYLAELGIVAVGADTHAVEVHPAEVEREHAPCHQILMVKNGVYILEYVDTRELAADGVSEFLFVLGQPRLVGAVNVIINPIAIA